MFCLSPTNLDFKPLSPSSCPSPGTLQKGQTPARDQGLGRLEPSPGARSRPDAKGCGTIPSPALRPERALLLCGAGQPGQGPPSPRQAKQPRHRSPLAAIVPWPRSRGAAGHAAVQGRWASPPGARRACRSRSDPRARDTCERPQLAAAASGSARVSRGSSPAGSVPGGAPGQRAAQSLLRDPSGVGGSGREGGRTSPMQSSPSAPSRRSPSGAQGRKVATYTVASPAAAAAALLIPGRGAGAAHPMQAAAAAAAGAARSEEEPGAAAAGAGGSSRSRAGAAAAAAAAQQQHRCWGVCSPPERGGHGRRQQQRRSGRSGRRGWRSPEQEAPGLRSDDWEEKKLFGSLFC
ncbi:uncharacterized protein RBU57_013891 [Macrochelys suwanniensis]